MNQMRSYDESLKNQTIIKKVLRRLYLIFDTIFTTIEEVINTNILSIDD